MPKFLLTFFSFFLISFPVIASDGLITTQSQFDVKSTADRLEKVLKQKGMTVFARIDHQAGAQKVGKKLAPTTLVIFGNPKIGTLLMQCNPQAAIDLPQKALIWQDAKGKTQFSYNDPNFLKKRHLLKGCDKIVSKISKVLGMFAKMATQK